MGPAGQGTPRVSDSKQGSGAAQRWRGQSSMAVMSSLRDLRDLAHRLSYTVGPLVGASNGGDGHGRAKVRDDDETPVEATATQSNATPSIYGLRET